MTGGYVARLEGGGKGTITVDGVTYPRDFTTSSGRIYTYHCPKAQRITADQGASLRGAVQGFEDVMGSDPAGYVSRTDVQTWVDHAIVEELTNNWDGYVAAGRLVGWRRQRQMFRA